MKTAGWVAALAGAAAVLAQTSADKPASVSGVVTNSLTGAPLLRAHVILRGAGRVQQAYGALTNGEGKFSIVQLPPGDYFVTAERVGFVAPLTNPNPATLGPGEQKDDFKLLLTPTGAITGRVPDAEGSPIQGASVMAEGGGAMKSATTDDMGRFRVGGLRAGKYRVKATPQTLPFPPEIRSDGTRELHSSATYYGGSLSAKSAPRLEVQPAAELSGIEIRLVSTPIVTVSGKVTGLPPGFGNARVELQQLTSFGSNGWGGSNVKPDGSFEIWRLDPGKYILLAAGYLEQNLRSRLQSAALEIEVTTTNLEHLELRLIPAFNISGQVRFEDQQLRTVPPQRVVLMPEKQGPVVMAELGADDSFTLEKVEPNRYRLTAGSGYVRSVRAGPVETEGDILDVSNGSPGPITITLSANFCEVSGIANNSKGPVEGATIFLAFTTGGDRRAVLRARSGPGGTYRFTGLAPGKYRLVATEDMVRTSQDLEEYQDIAEDLDLRAGEKVDKDLKQRAPDHLK